VSSAAPARKPSGLLVLTLIRPLAAMSVVAMLLGRAFCPSAAGMSVGMERLTERIMTIGYGISLFFAICASVVLVLEIFAVSRGEFAWPFQLCAVPIGGFVIVVTLIAAYAVTSTSAALVGVCGASFALIAAWDGLRAPFARAAAAVVGLVGAASLIRLVSVGAAVVAVRAGKPPTSVTLARGLATFAFVLDAAAIAAATTWIASRSRRVATPATIVAVIAAFVLTRQVLLLDPGEVGPLGHVLRRGVERLLTRPEPFIPMPIRAFVALLAPLVAAAALLAHGRVPALSGAVALALVVGSSAEMPLGAMCLLIASFTLALAARDDRGVWDMIMASPAGDVPSGEPIARPARSEPTASPRAPDNLP